MENSEEPLLAGFGGPGPEAWANGAAVLASALAREAQALAQAAAGLRDAVAPSAIDTPDIRRTRLILGAAQEAALRAALALEAGVALGAVADSATCAARLSDAAKRAGLSATTLVPLLRAAALAPVTDDAAARMAAGALAQELAERLSQ